MTDVEKVTHLNKVYAIIIRNGIKIDGVKFFTPDDYPIQVGMQLRKKDSEIKPHIHKPLNNLIKNLEEVIRIDYGKIEVTIYDENRKKIKNIILNSGDTFIAVRGGHGYKFLEESKVLEIKQGPYDAENDKELIE